MILKDLLKQFNINVDLPEYLYDEEFNEVFLKANLKKDNGCYVLSIKTRKEVIHNMFINPEEDYPVIISSILPNGLKNGVKFGKTHDDLVYI